MRGLVFAVVFACAGCSLFLLDGLNDDEQPGAPDAQNGADTGASSSSSSGSGGLDATTDTSTDALADGDGNGDGDGSDPYGDAVRADAPVGWWRLDEKTGASAANDSSGKGITASFVNSGGISLGQPGATKRGTAYVFDGTGELVLGDVFAFPSPAKYTFEAWVKPALAPTDVDYHAIFTKVSFQPAPRNGRYLYYYLPTPRIGSEEWGPTDNTSFVVHTIALPQDHFSHVVVTFDGSLPRLYVDGVLVKVGSKNADLANNATTFKWADGWIGALDELAVYDKALDAVRVKAHFDAAATSN